MFKDAFIVYVECFIEKSFVSFMWAWLWLDRLRGTQTDDFNFRMIYIDTDKEKHCEMKYMLHVVDFRPLMNFGWAVWCVGLSLKPFMFLINSALTTIILVLKSLVFLTAIILYCTCIEVVELLFISSNQMQEFIFCWWDKYYITW